MWRIAGEGPGGVKIRNTSTPGEKTININLQQPQLQNKTTRKTCVKSWD